MIFLESPADGIPELSDTPASVEAAVDQLASGSGPLAIDTERAGSFLSNDRACLIQVRREGAGTVLLDPLAAPDAVRNAAEFFNSVGWILHSSHDDLPCLLDLGFYPALLDDTLLAGAILGLEKIGLNPMMEDILGMSMEKGKGQEDWSRRPLPQDMLNYAALDVEKLQELRDICLARIIEEGREQWYRQECDFVLAQAKPVAPMDFASVKGVSKLRKASELSLAFNLHQGRLVIAQACDIPITSILPHSALIDIAQSRNPMKALQEQLRKNRWRGASFDSSLLFDAVARVLSTPPSASETRELQALLKQRSARQPQLPSPSHWQDNSPDSYRRYEQWRDILSGVAEDLGLRIDTIITVRLIKALAWHLYGSEQTVIADHAERILEADRFLAGWNVRPWQLEIILNVLDDYI